MLEFDITLVNVCTPAPSDQREGLEVYLPLGCLYLISALEQAGIQVDFRDYQTFSSGLSFPLDLDSFQSFLSDSAPIVGVSCMISMLPFVLLGTKRFKESHPEHKVILGGPGPSGVATAIVSSLPWIDMVVRGEGETTLVEVLKALKSGGDLGLIPGITYRDRSGIHHNRPRPRVRNLDEIAFPAHDRVNLSDYTNISIITGRGCPFKCAFCDVGPLWGNKAFFRSIDNVMEELDFLKSKYNLNSVHIGDDTFDLQRGRTETLCEEIKGLGLNWSCLARVDLMDEDLLDRMAKAGCDAVFLGIESGSDDVLKRINKKFTIEEATRKVEMFARYIPEVITSYIWGFPFETMEDFKLTLFSVVSMGYLGARVGLKLLSPMPMSPLGIEYRDQLEFSEDLCSVFASLGNVTPGKMSRRAEIPDEFKVFIKEYPDICAGFYYIKSNTIREKAEYLKRFSEKLGVPP